MNRMPNDDGTKPCALYRLYDADHTLLYVGMAFDVAARMRTHAKRQPWWDEVVTTDVTWAASRAKADAAETIAITLERPKYNDRKRLYTDIPDQWFPSLGVELRCADTVTSLTVAEVPAPAHFAEKIGIEEGAPVLISARSIVRGDQVIAWVARWQSPLPGSVVAHDERTGSAKFAPRLEHRDASSDEAATLGVEPGRRIDALWNVSGETGVGSAIHYRSSIAELIGACPCPTDLRMTPEELRREVVRANDRDGYVVHPRHIQSPREWQVTFSVPVKVGAASREAAFEVAMAEHPEILRHAGVTAEVAPF
jgi:predicted GIY-YIG superfamily endonuclease